MSRAPLSSVGSAILTLLLVLVATGSLPAQTKLRWKLQQGQKLAQVIEQNMQMNAKVGENDIKTTMVQTIDATWKVTGVDGQGSATIEQTFNRIQMKLDALGAGFEYDSDNPKELQGIGGLVAPALKALAGAEFTLTMAPSGKIQDVHVADETVTALQSMPGTAQLGAMFSKEGLIKMIQQGSQPFPDKPLVIGDSWTVKSENELPQVGKLVVSTKLTYAGPQNLKGKRLERIDLDLTTELPEGGNNLISLTEQSAKGTIYFDNLAGRISNTTLNQKMKMTITVAGNTIDQDINQTIKVKVTEVTN